MRRVGAAAEGAARLKHSKYSELKDLSARASVFDPATNLLPPPPDPVVNNPEPQAPGSPERVLVGISRFRRRAYTSEKIGPGAGDDFINSELVSSWLEESQQHTKETDLSARASVFDPATNLLPPLPDPVVSNPKPQDAVPYATVYAEATNLLPPPQQPGFPDPNPGPQHPIDTEFSSEIFDSITIVGQSDSSNKFIEERRKVSCISEIATGRITLDKDDQDKAKEKAIFTIGHDNDLFPIGGFLSKEPGDEEETRRKNCDVHAVGVTTFDNDSDEKRANINEEEQMVCCDQRFTRIDENDDSESGIKEKEGEVV